MTLPNERYRAALACREYLVQLLTAPRIPAQTRIEIRGVLKHAPTSYDIDQLARRCPDILERPNEDT